jgi:hypothetical protein
VTTDGGTRVELVVKLVPGSLPGGRAHQALLALAADLGIALRPVDPAGADPDLATYHVALVSPDAAARAVAALHRLEDVEAAYSRPPGEPPVEGMHHDDR